MIFAVFNVSVIARHR